jgi:phenylalanine-4-hydroxylase
MSSDTQIPPHLRKYIVEQDYAAYSERDQAVWRFVVGHTHRRLWDSAHPSYRSGFRRAGISTERIPNLREMSRELEATGFSVACVDGFIPPRAFQAFQARGVLPVAADIRRAEHLTYTPAPDIIHEAAGHAPFLAHPDYAGFLRRIGAVSERAFESSRDRAIYRAIYTLSELKEEPGSTSAQIVQAEAELLALRAASTKTSEATRMARLYWWTVEYGLVGKLDDYRLYGAGLLSSIGEAHFCHDPRVRKLPLSAACVDVDYDITQAQPQLFVAADFAQLDAVLSEVEATLSHVRGGQAALEHAQSSEELASLELDDGVGLAGIVHGFDAGSIRLVGRCAIAQDGVVAQLPVPVDGYVLPLGALRDGTPLSALSAATLERHRCGRQLCLTTQADLQIDGELVTLHERHGRVYAAVLRDLRIQRGGERLIDVHGPSALLFASRVRSAAPLAPEGYYPPTAYPALRVPKPRHVPEAEESLIALHAQVSQLLREPANGAGGAQLEAVHAALRDHPREWLLRVNLLEALLRRERPGQALVDELRGELARLEAHFQGREPIATGLAALEPAAQRSS